MATPIWQPGTMYQPGDLVQPASAPAPVAQVITNPGFETGDFTGWSSTTNWAVVVTSPFAGTYCAEYQGATPSNDYIEMTSYGNTVPGQSVTASCRAFVRRATTTVQATGRVAIAWYTAANAFISESLADNPELPPYIGGTAGWVKSTVTAVAPPTAARARIRIYAYKNLNLNPRIDSIEWNLAYAQPLGTAMYKATQTAAGISGSSEPVWPGVGLTVVDNQVTWLGVDVSRVVYSTSPVLVSGAVEPTFPTEAGVTVLDNTIAWEAITGFVAQAPESEVVVIGASKIFAGDDDIEPYSATNNPLDWTTANDAGYLPTGIQLYGANPIAAVGLYRGNLVVFNSEGFQMWQIDEDPAQMALLDAVPIGCIYHRSVQSVGDDLLLLTSQGVRNLSIAAGSTNLSAGSYGEPVDPLIRAAVLAGTSPRSIYWPAKGQYWLAFGTQVFVLSLYKRKASWQRYVFPEAIADFTLAGDVLYARTSTHKVWAMDDVVTDDTTSSTVTITVASPAVVTWNAHGRANGEAVVFTTTGALPTGLTAGVRYYIVNQSTNAFNVAATVGGTPIVTTGTQSGVHTAAAGVEFEGVVQWPWLDLGNIGVQKTLEAFDLVGTGEVDVQIGYNQKDLSAYTTAYTIAECDTLPAEPIPLPLSAPSFSLKLTFAGGQSWEWQAANLYVGDNRGGGARG
jgi:hypothetical protein